MTGSLLAMEAVSTFGCTTSTATFHSLYANADNPGREHRSCLQSADLVWLSDDRTAMRFTAPGWNNQTTVLEKVISVTSSAGSAARTRLGVQRRARKHAHRCRRADVPARRHDGRNGGGHYRHQLLLFHDSARDDAGSDERVSAPPETGRPGSRRAGALCSLGPQRG